MNLFPKRMHDYSDTEVAEISAINTGELFLFL